MAKLARFFLSTCILSMLLSACGASPQPAAATPAASGSQRALALPNMIVQAEGEVNLRRPGWADFVPAGFGTVVVPGDLIRVASGGSAAVFCGAAAEWAKGAASLAADGTEHGVPCPSGRPRRPWSDVAALRAEIGSDLPHIISPRNTALLDSRPPLQWQPLEGASSYTVSLVSDDGQERAPVKAQAALLDWPESWAPLQPDATYVLVAAAGDRRSDAGPEGNTGLGFWLLPDKDAAAIHEQEKQLRSAGLTDSAATLLVAGLYMQAGLRAEAAQMYAGIAGAQNSPAVQLALGQAYLEMGAAGQARSAFEQGASAAQAAEQSEFEAAALVGIGLAMRLLQDDAGARQALQGASTIYTRIGDRDGAAQVQELLAAK
jgi:hypothetical protein